MDRWWITDGPLPSGGTKLLGPFESQELALRVRSYMETARQAAGDGATYWVDEDPAPPGRYAGGGRSPIVYTWLCARCGGYPPMARDNDPATVRCHGCGTDVPELHKFQALILSAANGGCMCEGGFHRQVTGDLPDEPAAMAVLLEVQTRPAPLRSTEGDNRA